MRKLLYIFCPAAIMLLTTCTKIEKNANNYFPQIETISATVTEDGTVEVVGRVISSGNTDIYYAGFCMDTLPNPRMLSNQRQVAQLDGNTFKYSYRSLDALKRYYFRAWATNKQGYSIGGDVHVDSVFATGVVPACILPADTFSLSGTATVTQPYTFISTRSDAQAQMKVHAATTGHSVDIQFAERPVSSKYIITKSPALEPGYVRLTIDGVAANGGAELVVKQLGGTKLQITICGVGVVISNINYTFKTSLICK